MPSPTPHHASPITHHASPITHHASPIVPPSDFNPRTDPPLDFLDGRLGSLTAGDYAVLGFMAGLEVHQQLATTRKLFCRCPAGRYVERYDAEVLRHMRPTLSELGEYDGTALMEFKKKKEIVYRLDRGTVCTYEMDDTPPFEIAPDAVAIRQLSLEEDSCREVSDVGHRITFRTDRLGMPLTEAVTEPDLVTPWEVREAGRLLADVARATGKVRRGPGAARQDVNVSIAGGRRVEIKGVAHHAGLPLLVHVEAFRQLNLLRVKAELARRGVSLDDLPMPPSAAPWEGANVVEAGVALRGTTSGPLVAALDRGMTLLAVRLPGFGGLLAHPTQPGRAFDHELAERVRVIACPVHRPFLFHSDQEDSGVSGVQWNALRRALGAERGDAVVLVWGEGNDAATAACEVVLRARDALQGVPPETRQAHRDGTTGFERILPGPDRMYPDTDTPPIALADALVERIRARLPERPWERVARFERLGLPLRVAHQVARAPWADLFDGAGPAAGASARRLARLLLQRLPYYERRGMALPRSDAVAVLVRAVEAGRVRPEALPRMLDLLVRTGATAAAVVEQFAADRNDAVPDAAVRDVVSHLDQCRSTDPAARLRWAMGRLMPRLLGTVAPPVVRAMLETALHAVEVAR